MEAERISQKVAGYSLLLHVLGLLEAGMVHLSYADLEKVPATLIDAWAVFKRVKETIRREQPNS